MSELSARDKIYHDIRNALTVMKAASGEIEMNCKKTFRINHMLTAVERQNKSVDMIMELLEQLEKLDGT